MPLINQLKDQRAVMNINQAELGRLVGVSRQTISLIECGGILLLLLCWHLS